MVRWDREVLEMLARRVKINWVNERLHPGSYLLSEQSFASADHGVEVKQKLCAPSILAPRSDATLPESRPRPPGNDCRDFRQSTVQPGRGRQPSSLGADRGCRVSETC